MNCGMPAEIKSNFMLIIFAAHFVFGLYMVVFLFSPLRYESGWRAVMAYTDGVILVYDPDSPGQDQQLTLWYDFFVKRNGLRDEQCLIFAHRANSTNEKFKPRKFLFNLLWCNFHFTMHSCYYCKFEFYSHSLPIAYLQF